ncbi:unnamed protein product [Brachionus calyciflorus]|uniref:Uncharacterized protein n=1 Tax=Brachionus calyciflorus TaxID=104777 RepID=A0A814LWU6_9BILA|nr:unnamed protein product [Brachionus calyciflorus]
MLVAKLIQSSESSRVSPIMLVSKRNCLEAVIIDERFDRTLKTYAYTKWSDATTYYTPFDILYGRRPKTRLDLVIENQFEPNYKIFKWVVTGQDGLVVNLMFGESEVKLREV